MKKYKNLGLTLDDVIFDSNFEKLVLENLKRCYKFAGKEFKLIFWTDKLTDKDIKSFVDRNSDILFEFNTQITNKHNRNSSDIVWYVIDEGECKVTHRYQCKADILFGLVEYIKIVQFLNKKKREDNENSYNR